MLDYLGSIYSKDKTIYGLDKEKLANNFIELGFQVEYIKFKDIDFRRMNFKNKYVLYQSSQDIGLVYKSYIEDVLLGLLEQEAILIPEFKYFRAHHNKVFAEILRDTSDIDIIKNIKSKHFGTYDEYCESIDNIEDYSVFKKSEGALGSGVRLLKNQADKISIPKELSEIKTFKTIIDKIKDVARPITNLIKRIMGIKVYYEWQSRYRDKFIIQRLVPNLKCDFKVLVFGEKYYLLQRSVRDNDFRASGSGNYFWPEVPNEAVLNYAKDLFELFKSPFASFDVAYNGDELFLLEYQFIMFGTITLERSNFYYKKINEHWDRTDSKSEIEKETAISISEFILKNFNHS